ncbi:hypothetical protein [Phormidium sp. CCY1219]|uniref:hypothetical protein n=1 Tax=Phormidium sp. CCY1219 TaxID=2886104 RepID=UPI002D1EA83F|nr:hypothetical protein [Phormidium sp. CCY1219]MEB3829359.1 hypothetical protein [Phormidium sp. CCY1219]
MRKLAALAETGAVERTLMVSCATSLPQRFHTRAVLSSEVVTMPAASGLKLALLTLF